jgi:hypothetical protein
MNNVSWSSLVWPHVVSFHIDIETTLILRDKQGRETGSLVVLPLGLDSGDGIVNSLKHVVHKTNSWRIQLTREPRHKTYEPALDTIFAQTCNGVCTHYVIKGSTLQHLTVSVN